MSFGRVVAEARKQAGLSQKELAASIFKEGRQSISPQYLNDIEHDRRNAPPDYLIEQFARVLGVSEDYLYYRAGELPTDVRDVTGVDEKKAVAAYKAFRQKIYG
jgi:transcriptional regulator with XRE-family HTH domain